MEARRLCDMLLLGRAIFVIGFIGLTVQIFEAWLGLLNLPITKDHMLYAMLWWAGFGSLAAGGVLLMKKYDDKK
jgi:hypothetical protein